MRERVLIVTDAWMPQVNGVVVCLSEVARELRGRGMEVEFITPREFATFPLPTYPEIRLALNRPGEIETRIESVAPTHVHIATEGPLGLQARIHCHARGLQFTTSFHTRFAEYIAAKVPIPTKLIYRYLRWFHSGSRGTLVPTPSLLVELRSRGFRNLRQWTRGVDHERFHPGPKTWFLHLPPPHLLYVGRVSTEKNIGAFLELRTPGSKVVVGDGPQLAEMRQRHPQVHFLGLRIGNELAEIYRSADVFVFPSRTDTFGNVMLEALASGVPVAAFPVTGPLDVLTDPTCGAMNDDLGAAIARALTLARGAAVRHAARFTWEECADIFARNLVPARTVGTGLAEAAPALEK